VPRKHGPYYQLTYMREGRSGTRVVEKEELAAIQEAVANYARLRELVDGWIDLSTELFELKLQLRPPVRKPTK